MTALSRFAEKWCNPDYPPTKVGVEDVRAAEQQLRFIFPEAYVRALVEVGAVSSTLGLLHAITTDERAEDSDRHLHDLSQLCVPQEVAEGTLGYRAAGMPDHLSIIGSDCMGNVFCFSCRDEFAAEQRTAPIYFWDHDYLETTRIADDFESWITMYLEIAGNCESWKNE